MSSEDTMYEYCCDVAADGGVCCCETCRKGDK